MLSIVQKELNSLKFLAMRDGRVQGNYIHSEDTVSVAKNEGKSNESVISVLQIRG